MSRRQPRYRMRPSTPSVRPSASHSGPERTVPDDEESRAGPGVAEPGHGANEDVLPLDRHHSGDNAHQQGVGGQAQFRPEPSPALGRPNERVEVEPQRMTCIREAGATLRSRNSCSCLSLMTTLPVATRARIRSSQSAELRRQPRANTSNPLP